MNNIESITKRWSRFLNEDKQPKPQAVAGNRYHDEDGKFSTADDAASESIGYWEPAKPGTIQGKWRRRGSGRTKVWRKLGCGRKNQHDPNIKAKHKCKIKEDILIREEDDVLLIKPDDFQELVFHEMKKLVQDLADKEEESLDEQGNACPPGCSRFRDVLVAIDQAVKASKGDLGKGSK